MRVAAPGMTGTRPTSYHARLFARRRNVSPEPAVPMTEIPTVAYFCMEFGLHEEFPIYAGGLGILAGDFIKSARDLGAAGGGGRPALGARLRRQRIGADGLPVDEYPGYDAGFLATPACACASACAARGRVRVSASPSAAATCRSTCSSRTARRGPLDHAPPLRGRHRRARRAGDPARHRRRARAQLARASRSTPITSTRATRCSPASS